MTIPIGPQTFGAGTKDEGYALNPPSNVSHKRLSVDFSDFVPGHPETPITIGSLPAGTIIWSIALNPITMIAFDTAYNLDIGQLLDFDVLPNGWIGAGSGFREDDPIDHFPGISPAYNGVQVGNSNISNAKMPAYVFGADPIQAGFDPASATGNPDPTMGHIDFDLLISLP